MIVGRNYGIICFSDRKINKMTLEQILKKWHSDNPISHYLPLHFPQGSYIQNLHAYCDGCKKPANEFHAALTKPYRDTAIIDGIGYCQSCHMYTPVLTKMTEVVRGQVSIQNLNQQEHIKYWAEKDTVKTRLEYLL